MHDVEQTILTKFYYYMPFRSDVFWS